MIDTGNVPLKFKSFAHSQLLSIGCPPTLEHLWHGQIQTQCWIRKFWSICPDSEKQLLSVQLWNILQNFITAPATLNWNNMFLWKDNHSLTSTMKFLTTNDLTFHTLFLYFSPILLFFLFPLEWQIEGSRKYIYGWEYYSP